VRFPFLPLGSALGLPALQASGLKPQIPANEWLSNTPKNRSYVESLVAAEEAAGVPSERVVVAGFSQGGAVALMMLVGSWWRLRAVAGGAVSFSQRLGRFQEESNRVSGRRMGRLIAEHHPHLRIPYSQTRSGLSGSSPASSVGAGALGRLLQPGRFVCRRVCAFRSFFAA
jgi:pimeloyl-ACP methyl ester carboxylesterase